MSGSGTSSVDLCALLKATCVEGTPAGNGGVFCLVPKESPVTFYSQQIRAFNLVAALNQHAKDFKTENGPEIKVAVVGAGLAGITAASALVMLKNRNIQVTVYERAPCNFPEQRFNTSRHIHPRILFWPEHNFENAGTDLPYLNWSKGQCNEVVRGLDDQFAMLTYFTNEQQKQKDRAGHEDKKISGSLDEIYNTHVKGYFQSCNGYVLNIDPVGSVYRSLVSESYQYIIFTVGFGVERILENVPGYTYWQNDPYSQIVYRGNSSIAVSGTGDGALTDFIRLAFVDFDHGEILRKVTQRLQRSGQTEKLKQANKEFMQDAGNEDEDTTGPRTGAAAIRLWQAFKSAEVAERVAIETIGEFRKGASLTLIGKGPLPLEKGASLLNRIITYCLLQPKESEKGQTPTAQSEPSDPLSAREHRFSYFQGEVERADRVATGTVLHFKNGSRLHFDHAIIRHGTQPVIGNVAPTWNPGRTYSKIISNAGMQLAGEVEDAFGHHELVKRERRATLQAGSAHLVPVLKAAVLGTLTSVGSAKGAPYKNYKFACAETKLSGEEIYFEVTLIIDGNQFKNTPDSSDTKDPDDTVISPSFADKSVIDIIEEHLNKGLKVNNTSGEKPVLSVTDRFNQLLIQYIPVINDKRTGKMLTPKVDVRVVIGEPFSTPIAISGITANEQSEAGNDAGATLLTCKVLGADLNEWFVAPAHLVRKSLKVYTRVNPSDSRHDSQPHSFKFVKNIGPHLFSAKVLEAKTYPSVYINKYSATANLYDIGVIRLDGSINQASDDKSEGNQIVYRSIMRRLREIEVGPVVHDELLVASHDGNVPCSVVSVNCFVDSIDFSNDFKSPDREAGNYYAFELLFKINVTRDNLKGSKISPGSPIYTKYGRLIGMVVAQAKNGSQEEQEVSYYAQELAPALKAIGYTLVQDD